MGILGTVRRKAGNVVAGVGHMLNLPEFGLSETIGGYTPGTDVASTNLLPGTTPRISYPAPLTSTPSAGVGGAYPIAGGNPAATSGTDTGTGGMSLMSTGGGGEATPNLIEYPQGSGYYYDLNDPNQRQAFYDRRLIDLNQSRDEQISQIDQQIADLIGSSKDYVTNYFDQLKNLGATKGAGDMSRIDTYSAAAPNAFQSSEANSYDTANQNYLTTVGNAATQANEAVGANYLANPNDPNQLGSDTTYGRQLVGYNQGRNDVGTQYNDYLAGIQQQNNPATNPFRFDYQAAGMQAPAAVNLTGANPFVDFKSIPTTAQPGTSFKPSGNAAFSQGTPLENFLGTAKLNQQDTDFLKKYLLGRA